MKKDILIVEPFYGGSHKQLIDTITDTLDQSDSITYDLLTLPPKKWHWKARCGALIMSDIIPLNVSYNTLICSSDLSLSELLGIQPNLQRCHKVVYFHENQLVYPVQKTEVLDFQFGFNQILTALAADEVCFNSTYNMESFFQNIIQFLHNIPGYKPKDILNKIKPKSKVLYFPLRFDQIKVCEPNSEPSEDKVLHIVWAHRWEHDKDPGTFFDILLELQENGFRFEVSVLGQGFADVPSVFLEAKSKLKCGTIKNWGFQSSKEEYYSVLKSCDIAVSTALHEFFGVSMMECTYCGCYPLCPNRLSYPELYPAECLYNTSRQLYKRLREFCQKPWLVCHLRKKLELNFSKYSWEKLQNDYFRTMKISSKRPVSYESSGDATFTKKKLPKMDGND